MCVEVCLCVFLCVCVSVCIASDSSKICGLTLQYLECMLNKTYCTGLTYLKNPL